MLPFQFSSLPHWVFRAGIRAPGRAFAAAPVLLVLLLGVFGARFALAGAPVTGRGSQQVVQPRFLGFAAEWDAMFFQAPNRAAGVEHADLELISDRIQELGLSQVRMFVGVYWWEPVLGSQDFSSPELDSLYAQLQVCKNLGLEVDLVIWRPAPWCFPWMKDPDSLARSTADLLAELEARGLGVVKYLTLVNEPDFELYGSFEDYAGMVRALRAELDRRGLEVALLGPDDAGGLPWFEAAVQDLGGELDGFDSHSYSFSLDTVEGMSGFVKDRMDLLAAGEGTRDKPFLITEMGSVNNLDAFHSLDIDTFERGLFSAEAGLRALASGAASVSHWCLHDTYYIPDQPGVMMGYGLLRFKDQGWEPRPIFHAWGLLARNATRDSVVLELKLDDPALAGALVRRPDGVVVLMVSTRDSQPGSLGVDLSDLIPGAGSARWYRYDQVALEQGLDPAQPRGEVELVGGVLTHKLAARSFTVYELQARTEPGIEPEPLDAVSAGDSDAGVVEPVSSSPSGNGGCSVSGKPEPRAWIGLFSLLAGVFFAILRRLGPSTGSPSGPSSGQPRL